ncbi:hypothetical protein [Jannaschia pohangensis]|nr:hypothetical protein [Jannaschia pohangensis]
MSLRFGTFGSSPVVHTHFSIEQPMGEIGQPVLIHSFADRRYPRFDGSDALIGGPRDAGEDGIWRVEAQWTELLTGKSWRAAVDVPVDRMTRGSGAVNFQVIFGPNGLLEIDSDQAGPKPLAEVNTIGRTCGTRVSEADRDWTVSGLFPGKQERTLAAVTPPVGPPTCPPRD